MGSSANYFAAFICLLVPSFAHAQSVGQVECPHAGGTIDLYSSMMTLDVRATLQCGEQVQITGRYDSYFGVRTAKSEVGYVPVDSLLLLKDKPGAKARAPKTVQPARERTPRDTPGLPAEAAPSTPAIPSEFILRNGTAIHLKLGKTISSASAHVGDRVDLQVTEEVIVDGFSVIPQGAEATGLVKEAEPKKRLGHGGKLAFSIDSVRLKDNEKAAVRSFQESTGAHNSAGVHLPLASGKDVVFTQGAEFIAYVDGDIRLTKAAFQAPRNSSSVAPAPADHKTSPPPGF